MQEEGRRRETDSGDLAEAWEKRGLVEEKQKCLRTFLCDYTVPDKSSHSSCSSVLWLELKPFKDSVNIPVTFVPADVLTGFFFVLFK